MERRARLVHGTTDLPTRLCVVVGVLVFAGAFVRYRQNYFLPGYSTYLLNLDASILAGTADAPLQYRAAMPWAARLLSTVMSFPHAVLVLDGLLLGLAVVALAVLLRRHGALRLLPLAALGFAYWALNTENWAPEVLLLVAVVSVGALVLDLPRPPVWAVAAVGLAAVAARADYGASLGVAVGAHAWSRRRLPLAAVAVALAAVAAVLTWFWARVVFPQARYRTGVVQLGFNVLPHSWIVLATFFGPALLVPAVLLWRRRWTPLAPVLVWFAAEFAVTFVVGRVEENRILLPFAAVVWAAAGLAFREVDRAAPAAPS